MLNTHIDTTQHTAPAGATAPTDAQIDKAIYAIDGVMNHSDPEVVELDFPFMPEHLAKMRAVIRDLWDAPAATAMI